MRDNLENFRPTQFLISLLDGTVFGIADPRLKVMVAPAPDGVYRGLIPTQGMGSLTTSQKPNNPWNENTAPTTATKGRFLYTNKASFPLMTYSELQLIKAEAALKANKASVALDAYKKAVTAHFDFVNQYADTPISASDRDTYLATVIPTDPAALTLSMVMLQKYIAQFGWGYHETWSDLRRYHYSSDVFTGFTLPSSDVLWPDNNGLPAQRFRPRYNSEYVWNKAALDKVKGFDKNYHTYEMWFTKTIDTELY
ncbi:MAG: SusD/RagB family nutrient-binding outer membrane lipoprotein, partial [Bacteroidota bacterium]|nr:SusD/RagB family nutrient-binding outer membrane lipoprotein [Bacteroidota bacterium]